ncbi:tape measure protein [Phyllobacterium sp. YR531]|uniref:tape measure protein n=1 Tax=Phyllobacterium sp. YR531 TaxID=1144343 RepID=UPI00026F5B58|nr:tape measure protein [Phyllobacterium sp. YR531]EJN04476.1 tape measure domain containing protein [Phyllobacterium sp. YR531]
MATDEEKLLLSIEARTALLERQMKNASKVTGREFKGMQRQAESAAAKMNAAFSKVGRAGGFLAGGFVGAAALKSASSLIDSSIKIENSLKSAGLAGEDLTNVYDQLFAAAQRNAVPIGDLATLYGRASLAAKDLGVNQGQLVKFTDNVALALRAGGQSASESAGALLQLGQAIGGTKIQAEEYGSLIDGAPALLQAVAAGMKETGGSVGALTRLVKDGKVSSKAFFDAFAAGAPILQEKVAGAEQTVSSGFVRLFNVLTDVAGRFNKSSTAAKTFGGAMDEIATEISSLNFETFIGNINAIVTAFKEAQQAGQNFFTEAGHWTGLDNIGKFLAGPTGERSFLGGAIGIKSTATPERQALDISNKRLEIEKKISDLQNSPLKNSPLVKRDIGQYQAQLLQYPEQAKPAFKMPSRPFTPTPILPEKVVPVSLADYPVDPTKTPKTPKAKAAPRTADSRITDDIQAIRDRTEALKVELGLVGQSYEAQEKRRMSLDLEQAALADLKEEARKKGQTDLDSIKLSPEHISQIDAVSTAYARQADELRRVQDSQERAEQASSEFYDTFKSGAMDALTGAASLSDALSNLAKKLGDLLLNSAFDALFKPASGGSGGGAFGGIFGAIGKIVGYAKGTNNAPGGLSVVGEKGPELMNVPKGAQIIPNHKLRAPSMPSLKAGGVSGGAGTFTYAPVIDNRGASAEAVSRLEMALAKDRASFEANTIKAIRKANKTNTRLN